MIRGIALGTMLIAIAIACGSGGDDRLGVATAEVAPIDDSAATVSSIAAPLFPTPTPTAIPIFEEPPEVWDLLGFVAKPFPSELENDSDPLPSDRVVALWEDFLSDTRVEWQNLSELTSTIVDRLCADGTGLETKGEFEGRAVEWKVSRSPADRWNKATLTMTFDVTPQEVVLLGVNDNVDIFPLEPLNREEFGSTGSRLVTVVTDPACAS